MISSWLGEDLLTHPLGPTCSEMYLVQEETCLHVPELDVDERKGPGDTSDTPPLE